MCGLARAVAAPGAPPTELLTGSCVDDAFECLHNLSCLQAALRSPHLLSLQPLSTALQGRCDAFRCMAAAVAWRELADGAELTLDDGQVAVRCTVGPRTLAELLDLAADDYACLPPPERQRLLDSLLVRDRVWALTRQPDGAQFWRADCATTELIDCDRGS